MPLGSEMLLTSLAPSLKSKLGNETVGGATAGAAFTTGAGLAAAVSTGGAAAGFGVSWGLGDSGLTSGGLGFGGSGGFSFTIVTANCFNFLPRMPSRAAK